MKRKICVQLFSLAILIAFFASINFAQQQQTAAKPLIKRTTYKNETIDFGVGGTISIVGAPEGSITIEGWQKNQIEIAAEVEMQAPTEADLAELAKVNGFVIDNDFGHIRITSVGTHDKTYLKRVAKKFPKNLLGLPFKIDYTIKVPVYSDLEIDGGKGDLTLSNVEGAMRINVLETNAKLNLIGGSVIATFGKGDVNVVIPNRSWRGRTADIQLASGTMNVQLPFNLNANLDAEVLRVGKVENNLPNLKPMERTKFSEKSILAKAGNGGAPLNFTVGDGTLKLAALEN